MAGKLEAVKREDSPGPTRVVRSMADMLADEMDEVIVPRTVGLPPSVVAPKRSARTRPLPDLTGMVPLWLLIGPGDAGKTTFARYIGGKMVELYPDSLLRNVLVAADAGTRLLPEFFSQVMQPPSADVTAGAEWLRKLFDQLMRRKAGGMADLGADALSFREVVRTAPDLPTTFKESGIALIAAYVLTPAIDDVAILESHVAGGFVPENTALVLNGGRADSPGAFDAIRKHPAYQAALARGAVEIWVPKLEPQDLALAIEGRRFLFHEARDGTVPPGNANPPLSGMQRSMVRQWLTLLDTELAPLDAAGWMLWSA